MADTEYLRLFDGLWGDEGDRADPESVGINRLRGWDVRYEQHGTGKFPERSVFNQMLRELTGLYRGKMTWGVLPWGSTIAYPAGGMCVYDGRRWYAEIDDLKGDVPGSAATHWREW